MSIVKVKNEPKEHKEPKKRGAPRGPRAPRTPGSDVVAIARRKILKIRDQLKKLEQLKTSVEVYELILRKNGDPNDLAILNFEEEHNPLPIETE